MINAGKGWHIANDGKVRKCTADKYACHYSDHFRTREEARQVARVNAALAESSRVVLDNKIKTDKSDFFNQVNFVKKLPPQIYAFVVDALADGLHATKIGDTTRGVEVRLNEWRQKGGIYENLQKLFNIDACFTDENGDMVYVRDYNFHVWLKNQGYQALTDVLEEYPHLQNLPEGVSQEFFFHKDDRTREITEKMLIKSLEHQKENYGRPASPYAYYTEIRGQQVTAHYSPVHEYEMRPFQDRIVTQAVNYFHSTKDEDAQFLLSAPTRSGKSFMAANTVSQMFAASPKKNNCAVVVSGFAEIEDEWKATFESHKKFAREDGTAAENKCGVSPCECSNRFKYLNVTDLRRNQNAVEDAYSEGYDNVVVFLTLQDLSGSTKDDGEVKPVHTFLKKEDSVDFLIGDEAHFAMFSDGRYQDSIKTVPGVDDDANLDSEVTDEESREVSKMLGTMKPTLGKLFVTATPYNNVPWGSKFNLSVNAAVIREGDIRKEKDEWDANNAMKDDAAPEWANPSYGLPQKTMFGLDVGMSPNELFKVTSAGKFVHEQKVRQFISGIFGLTDQKGVPNFFGNKEFREAGLGQHIYAPLPSRKACDAFETELVRMLKSKGLTDYEVLNISSANPRHLTTKKSAAEIKDEITQHAKAGRKTITLTCNRMGTGVTQEYWDTVLLLRTMSSAQQFQQTAGRPGTPNVSTRNNMSPKVRANKKLCRNCETNEIRAVGKFLCQPCYQSGGEPLEEARKDKIFKHVEKPNVAVISLDPGQLVKIRQEAIIADMDGDRSKLDSDDVDKLTQEDLEATPLYIVDESGLSLERVTASNIMEHFLSHLKTQGVAEMVSDISINTQGITPELENAIRSTYLPTFPAKKEFTTKIVEEDIQGKSILERICMRGDCEEPVRPGLTPAGNPYRLCEEHFQEAKQEREGRDDESVNHSAEEEYRAEMESRIKNCYISALLYSVLSIKPLTGVDSIIRLSEQYAGARRLARHLNLDLEILKQLKAGGVTGLDLDNRIKLLSSLSENNSFETQWERLTVALNSFKRFSNNEIPTSDAASEKLVDTLKMTKDDYVKVMESDSGVIDTGSKSAVNLVKLSERAKQYGVDISDKLWSVPTSGATYELTRRVYKDHNWDLDKIIFHDNLDNLETVELIHLFQEQQQCQSANPTECRFHGKRNGKDTLNREIEALETKMDDKTYFKKMRKLIKNAGRFNFCVSNPPYQKEASSDKQRKRTETYSQFIELGSKISDVSVMVHPLRAFRGTPALPSPATQNIMNSEEFSVEHVEQESSKLFPTVEIKGALAITRFERGSKNKIVWEEIGTPTEAINILNKVRAGHKNWEDLSNKIHPAFHYTNDTLKKFNLKRSEGIQSNHFETQQQLFTEKPPKSGEYLTVHGNLKQKRVTRYIKKALIDNEEHKIAEGYKLLVPGAMKYGDFGEEIGETIIAGKNTASTRTFVNFGPFRTKKEAENLEKYLKTKFARMLLSTRKLTQNAPARTYGNIPQQNFKPDSDIDWSGSVKSVDEQLFRKYGLNETDIAWIEANVREMK